MEQTFIRSATPKDASFIAWAILAASRGHLPKGWFDIALSLPEDRCLLFLSELTTSRLISRWHYSRFLLVESAGRPVAALCAFRSADALSISPPAILETAKEMNLPEREHTAIWRRGSYQFTCNIRSGDDDWVLESIATAPEHRGRGYTSILLAEAIAQGSARALPRAEVTITMGNEPAERIYEKAGFRVANERRDPGFQEMTGAPGQRRLVRTLRT